MGGKKRKFSLKTPPKIASQEEYDLKQSFSKLNQYRSSNNYQTVTDNERGNCPLPNNSNLPHEQIYGALTNAVGDTYFRLEEKISALSDKNETAHGDLRKELECKIDKLKIDIEKRIDEIRSDKKWLIGLVVTIILAIAGYFIFPYQKASKNREDIIEIRAIINENIKPSINRNSQAIEKNSEEINNKIKDIHQLQNQQSKKHSTQ
jgi:hypothetical protein